MAFYLFRYVSGKRFLERGDGSRHLGLGIFVFSLLFWFPLVRGITRTLARMSQATRQIADGLDHRNDHGDVRVVLVRRVVRVNDARLRSGEDRAEVFA